MIWWLILLGGASNAASGATYTIGILHPVVDTAGDFSTNDDPDRNDSIRDTSTALNPTD